MFYDEATSRWKYLIVLATFYNTLVVWGLAYGVGVFQVIFMEEFSNVATVGAVSVITSLFSTLIFFTGPISSILTNRFGCRKVTWLGTLISAAGFFLTSQITSFWQLYLTFSLIGVGFGITFIPCAVIICQYFERRRALALAITCSGLGVGVFVMPHLVRLLVNVYNWRGAMIILSGITLHMTVSGSLFRPVEKPSTVITTKKKIISLKILKNSSFLCLLLNNFLILYGMTTFYVHLPAYLQTAGFSDDEGAALLSLMGVGSTVGRLMTGCFVHFCNTPLILYASTMGLSGFMVLVVPFLTTEIPLSLVTLSFGFFSSSIGPLLPLLITEFIGLDALSDAYGYILVAEGIGSFLGPPAAGFLYDFNKSYVFSMVFSGVLIIISAAVMIPPWWKMRKVKNSYVIEVDETGDASAKEDMS